MSCAAIPPSLLLTQVLSRLQRARERIAHGWPSIPGALASGPEVQGGAELAASWAPHVPADQAPTWVRVLSESLSRVERARALWAGAPDAMPPASLELSPCARELRLFLPDARSCADKQVAWADAGGLTRPQALCVVHLAVTLAKWESQQQRAMVAAHAFPPPSAPRLRAPPAQQPRHPERDAGPRSLRALAQVADAFSDWGEEETP